MYISTEITILAIGFSVIASVTDLQSRRIPNWLTGPMIVIGVSLHMISGGLQEVKQAIGGLALCGGLFLCFYLVGGMGAGDVKLIAAEGCLLGLSNAATFVICTALCGGGMALVLAYKKNCLRQTLTNVKILTEHHTRHGLVNHPELNLVNSATLRLPYALPIASGVVLTYISQAFLRMYS